ncbi:hypothetical protein Pcaca05_05620 [Pectobacterium carotovorum subsp. carotovorum]|nr:hypothetical protein Pcaca05_05620 [Pectobacterium carotovorum subsp. carotovorum]
MTLIEMEGFLRGKCIPRDMLVNESNAQYLLRKLTELQKDNETLRAMMREVEIQRDALVDVLEAISVYGKDTLSGPIENHADKIKWYRDGVAVMAKRAQSKKWEKEGEHEQIQL